LTLKNNTPERDQPLIKLKKVLAKVVCRE